MKVVRMSIKNLNRQAVIRDLKSPKSSNSIFISEEELKNMDTTLMIA